MDYQEIDQLSNTDFINMATDNYTIGFLPSEYSNTGKGRIVLKFAIFDAEREIHPNDYLKSILDNYFDKVSDMSDLNLIHEEALITKATLLNEIETFNGLINTKREPLEKYDFRPEANKINNVLDAVKGRLENHKLKEDIKNAKREKLKFWVGFVVGTIATGIPLIGVYIQWLKCK